MNPKPGPAVIGDAHKEKFFSNMRKSKCGCWIWISTKIKRGYGRMTIAGRAILAHRISWVIHNGAVPDGLFVLHDCPNGDNPSCVNPKHLWLGTQADNSKDMERKGRGNHPSGDNHGLRLHPERAARGDRNGARTHPESRQRGDAHFARRHPELICRGSRIGSSKLKESQVKTIRMRYASGEESQQAIANDFGVSQSMVSDIIHRTAWAHVP